MLKIIEKAQEAAEPVSYLFHFTAAEARAEAKAVKDVLSKRLVEIRSNDPNVPKPTGSPAATATATNGTGASGSASMAFASAVNSKPQSAKWFDDASLKGDIELQQSLMKKDKSLQQTYMDARETKPDSISDAAFNAQFWSTRTNLLRAHAIETNQKKGAYNVLSTVKPRTVDGELKLSISVEQVQMIFNQHPLVKRIYNENVPKLSEAEFWSRFFLSKLSKKLRGERISENDNPDPLFDKYDVSENTKGIQSKIMSQQVPHIIDLEANEENQGGFRSGNRKDVEMRPRANFAIVKTLNSLSEKIMANVAPSDMDLETSATVEDQTFRELELRDLRGDALENRIILNVKEQSRFFSKQDTAPSSNSEIFAKQVPSDVLFDIQADLDTLEGDGVGGIDLHAGISVNDDSDSDDDAPKSGHVGSQASRKAVQGEILKGILQRKAELYGHKSDSATPMGLPTQIYERCNLTHATTIEFLHQFWTAFLSGDPDRANELQYLAESLRRSAERIEAVAVDAEKERNDIILAKKKEIMDFYKKTGKKIRFKPDSVNGGRDAVLKMMQPTLDALNKAQSDYQRALAAEGLQATTEG
jgi:transcription initiation factor TFIIH subunit 1